MEQGCREVVRGTLPWGPVLWMKKGHQKILQDKTINLLGNGQKIRKFVRINRIFTRVQGPAFVSPQPWGPPWLSTALLGGAGGAEIAIDVKNAHPKNKKTLKNAFFMAK